MLGGRWREHDALLPRAGDDAVRVRAPGPRPPNCPDEPIALATALSGVPCLAADPIEGPISPEQLRAQISIDQPVCITITIEGLLAHVLVVVRCATGHNPLVTVLDPAHGGQRDQVSRHARAGGWGEGRGPWEETFLTG